MSGEKKLALVTGGTRGLGLEAARQLAAQDVSVLLGARDIKSGEKNAEELRAQGLDVRALAIDLNDEASMKRAAEWIEVNHGSLDILINNAAVLLESDGFPGKVVPQVIRETLEVNFVSTVALTQTLLPLLLKSKSARIVNVSSSVGSMWWNGDPNNPVPDNKWLGYAASKAALNMFTVQLAYELRNTSVKVNSICPGYVKTDMNRGGGFLTVEEGARPSVAYALIGDDGPSGGFFGSDGMITW